MPEQMTQLALENRLSALFVRQTCRASSIITEATDPVICRISTTKSRPCVRRHRAVDMHIEVSSEATTKIRLCPTKNNFTSRKIQFARSDISAETVYTRIQLSLRYTMAHHSIVLITIVTCKASSARQQMIDFEAITFDTFVRYLLLASAGIRKTFVPIR